MSQRHTVFSNSSTRRRFGLLTLSVVWAMHTAGCGCGDSSESHSTSVGGGVADANGNQSGNGTVDGGGGTRDSNTGGRDAEGNDTAGATGSATGGASNTGGGGNATGGTDATGGTTETVETGNPDRPSSGTITVDEGSVQGSVDGDEVALRFSVASGTAEDAVGSLNVNLMSVDGAEVHSTVTVDYDISAGDTAVLQARFELPEGVQTQGDLTPWSVKIDDGDVGGVRITKSLLYVLPPYEVRLEGPRELKQGKAGSYRSQVRDAVSRQPLADYPMNLTVKRSQDDTEEVVTTLSGSSDDSGVATFDVTLSDPGSYTIAARTEAEATLAEAADSLQVLETAGRVLLTTDKPIYQPGQTIHLRTLALVPPSNTPLAGEPVLLEVEDGKGNKIMKRELTSDDFGIASTTFQLGQVLNMGTFAVRATVRGQATEKSVEVARYSLPKFRSTVSTDRTWYSPGATAEATIDADYFFGKPVADAEVVVEAYTLDIGETLFTRVQGRTDSDGQWTCSIPLPPSIAGLPLEQGKALVTLRTTITDGAGQQVTQDKLVSIAAQAVQLSVVPEGGQLVPGLENTLFIFASDPDGAPLAGAAVELVAGTTTLTTTTDEFGTAHLAWTPASTTDSSIAVTVTPDGGAPVTEAFNFSSQAGTENVMVRTDRTIYSPGESVAVEVTSSDQSGYVYVDWLNDGQVVAMRTLEVADGEASFAMPIDATLLGTNRVEAYVVDDDGNVVRSGRTVFVKESGSLGVHMSLDRETYAPGDSATLTFDVLDSEGQPAVAALGLQIVDEAIYSLIDARPGLLETHFQLEEAYSQPAYEIHPPTSDVGSVLLTPVSNDADTAAAQQERAAAVLAALGDTGGGGVSTSSWPSVIAEGTTLLQPYWDEERSSMIELIGPVAREEESALSAQGCSPNAYYCDSGLYSSALFESVRARVDASDFWGNAYQLAEGSGNTLFVMRSAGPDETQETTDDATLQLSYADLGLESPSAQWEMDDGFAGGVPAMGTGGAAAFDPPTAETEDPSEEGSSGPRVRDDFPETLYVNPAVITDSTGRATVDVPLADSITQWRVTALANSMSGQLGSMQGGVTVFQDFFIDVDFPATLTRGDEVQFPVAVYNYLDTEQTVEIQLEPADWYTALGATSASITLGPAQVTGVRFPVRVETVGVGTLTVRGLGTSRDDAVARTVRVLPDGTAMPSTRSGALAAGTVSLPASFPESAVPGSNQLVLNVYPAYVSQVVQGMDSMLQEPTGCFEQTTSSTWPNVLIMDYMRATSQITPEIQMRAESLISTGYQRLLTFEHPGGGFSWFGTQDPAPYLSVTAFGLMEFVDMAKVAEVDEAMIARTRDWLVAQQEVDGSWTGDQTEFFSFHTSTVRNTAFVLWALATAEASSSALAAGISFVKASLDLENEDAYTLALVANAMAIAAPSDPLLSQIFERLEATKTVDGDRTFWDTGETQTTFYSAGSDAMVTTTALAAHAMLLAGVNPSTVTGAIAYLAQSKDPNGNFGSTQATIWSLRTLLLASQRGTESAVGTLDVSVDGEHFSSLELTEAQSDVMTTIEMGGHATTGEHQVDLTFVGTGKVSYNLVSSHNEPWAAQPEPTGPLAVSVAYDKTQLYLNETAMATVTLENLTDATSNMVLVTLGIPPGFSVVTEDLQAYLDAGTLSHFETTGKQLNLYVSQLPGAAALVISYHVRATMPVRAADGGAVVYPYYEPSQRSTAPSTTLEVAEALE